MPKRIVRVENSDGWTDWISTLGGGHRISCCDCGLAHDFQFRRRGRWETEWRASRNERSTAQIRRHMKAKK